MMPDRAETPRRGKAILISFLTPESDVYGVAPVKLRARKEDTAGSMSR
jgi:hypothetical protein